jgi:hypothetical protein
MLKEELAPQTLRIVVGAVIGLIFVLALPSVRLLWLNPYRYYHYEGTIGPLEALHDASGKVTAGQPISTVHAGGSFVWVRTLCFVPNLNVLSVIELREIATNKIVSRREFQASPEREGCGPRTIDVSVPVDAPPGPYSADRHLIIEPRFGEPISADLPPVEIEVIAK